MGDQDRLRALDLRTEDVVLIRLLVGVTLRIIGVVLIAWSTAQIVGILGWALQPAMFGAAPAGQIAVIIAGPAILGVVGLVMVFATGTATRRLVPNRLPGQRCPGCGYTITTLDKGLCTECGYEVSPLRESPRSDMDRLLVARSIIAVLVRLIGIGILMYGIGRLVLQALADVMLYTPPLLEEYESDRQLLWWAIAIVIGLVSYALADWLARLSLFGIRRAARVQSIKRED